MAYEILLFVIALGATLLLLRWRLRVATQKLTQQPLPDAAADFPQHPDGILLFFHHPRCGPCRQMSAQLDQLSAKTPARIVKINVGEQPELAQAFGIRATPTTLIIKDRAIQQAFIGATTIQKLATLLKIDGKSPS